MSPARDWRPTLHVGSCGKDTRVPRGQKTGARGRFKPWPHWGFCGKSKAGLGEQLRID